MTSFNLTCPGLIALSVMIWEHWKFEQGVWRTVIGPMLETEPKDSNERLPRSLVVDAHRRPWKSQLKMLAQEWL